MVCSRVNFNLYILQFTISSHGGLYRISHKMFNFFVYKRSMNEHILSQKCSEVLKQNRWEEYFIIRSLHNVICWRNHKEWFVGAVNFVFVLCLSLVTTLHTTHFNLTQKSKHSFTFGVTRYATAKLRSFHIVYLQLIKFYHSSNISSLRSLNFIQFPLWSTSHIQRRMSLL